MQVPARVMQFSSLLDAYLRIAQQPDLVRMGESVGNLEPRAWLLFSAGLELLEATAVWATMSQRYAPQRLKFSLNSSELPLEAHAQELFYSKTNF
jgi:hypothetical protein